ncbi:MAG: cyclic nucleotide-binding domain-containing protein [Pseudonocardiales bacterium]|nr:cyclic nucleotide-binding domain-containing protein [Pseudonocardiales bacterium]MBV9650008.1 cyclic nucleotide-binding domain-containing protein [Pseudonocardiales bacterium]
MTSTAPRLSRTELRELFLFADLTDTQLDWVRDHGDIVPVSNGEVVVREGEPARCFYVLLSGTIRMTRLVSGEEVEITRTDQLGAYFGAVQFYLGDQVDQIYSASVRALSDGTVLALPSREFREVFHHWYPMAVHLLQGLFVGLANTNALVGQRERLLALGKLSAGLTHELNNPAAAASRAAETLRERLAGMRHKLAALAQGRLDKTMLCSLTELQDRFVEFGDSAPTLTALQTGDLEDELADWLDDHQISQGWDLAAVFVAGGLRVPDLEEVASAVPDESLEGALRWLAYTVETENLLREIGDAIGRITALVDAAKQYSQLDRAPHQDIDLHDGLDATLVMLARKLGDGIRVVKDYDRELPAIPAYPAELNQVWTNLIVNAIDAMQGHGTLTVHTARDGEFALVEIGDTGSGIPPEAMQRIFEPFFTTKPVGQGTGLGLDVSWRVVVNRHHGDIQVQSRPGDTRFQVRLPLREPAQGS